VVGGLTGGETQLAAELLTAVEREPVEWGDTWDRGGVARTQQLGAEPGEVADHRAGDLVAADLVAGQHQRARPAFQVAGALGQQLVRGQQGVLPMAVQQPARAVQQVQRRRPGGQEGARQRQVAQRDRPRSRQQPQVAQAAGRVAGGVVAEHEVVAEQLVAGERADGGVGQDTYQMDEQSGSEPDAPRAALAEPAWAFTAASRIQADDFAMNRDGPVGRKPQQHPARLRAAEQGTGEDF
jgi:hypothetical protein